MPGTSLPSPKGVEFGLGIRAAKKCPRLSGPESCLKRSRVQVIFSVIEHAAPFTAKVKITIPVVGRFRSARRHEEINRHRILECRYPKSMIHGVDVHSP